MIPLEVWRNARLSLGAAFLLGALIVTTGAESAYRASFVSAPGNFAANHGASIAELGNGSLLACWYAGEQELAADVQIYCSRNGGDGQIWSKPLPVVRVGESTLSSWFANTTLGNTALHVGADGTVWLFYNAARVFRGWSATHVAHKFSKDHGSTWSDRGAALTSYWGNSVRNRPLALNRGRLLLPMHHELFGIYGYGCILTRDGDHWNKAQCARIPAREHLQPALARLPDGRIGAYLRNWEKKNVLLSVLSPALDSWSAPVPVNLPNPNSAVDVTAMTSHRLLMIYNHSRTSRAVLSAAVSSDGFNFVRQRDLENDPTSRGFSYPAVIRGRNGEFHVVYTHRFRSAIKHVAFDENWLMGR